MVPRLLSKDHNDNYNGYGFFSSGVECKVSQEINKEYFAQLEVLPNDRLYHTVAPGMLIKAKPDHKDAPQLFEVNEISVGRSGLMTITANHIKSYFLNNYIRPSFFASTDYKFSGTAAQAVQKFADSCLLLRGQLATIVGFDNTEKELGLDFDMPLSYETAFFGTGGFVETFGGEFHFDNDNVKIMKNRGQDFDKIIRYSSGISDFSQDMNNSGVYTHIYGFAKLSDDNGNLYIIDNIIDTGIATDFFYQRVLTKDYSDKFDSRQYDPSDYQTRELIKRKIYTRLLNYKSDKLPKLTEPAVNIRVTVEPELMKLKDIGIGDTVKVQYSLNGMTVRKKVRKVVYDSVREKYIEMELGDRKITLSNFIKKSDWR